MSDLRGRDDELSEIKQRLTALEQRFAWLEQWLAPSRPAPQQPVAPPPPARPPPLPPLRPAPAPESAQPSAPAGVPTTPIPVEPLSLSPQAMLPSGDSAPPREKTAESAFDLESLVGRNLASWAGGIVLLLGISFFLKYAWEQGWIRPPPALRVALAVLLGLVICGVGEWVWRRRMRGLAGALHGTGVAVLIAAFFGANRYFEPPVLSRGTAFAGVAISAALGVFLALRVDVMSVAILALVGAYLSPAVLSSGVDKSLELLSYLAVLAAAVWALSFIKSTRRRSSDDTCFHWQAVRWVALAGSYAWFFAWWHHFGERNVHHTLALTWLAFIFLGFLAEAFFTLQIALPRMPTAAETPLLRLPRAGPDRPRADSGLAVFLLGNTAVACAAGWWVLEDEPQHVLALIALGLAAVLGVIAFLTVSRALLWSAMLQSAALVTLAVPLWFNDFSITMAWLALAVATAAVAWQLNLPAARAWAVALLFLAAVRLVVADSFAPGMRVVVLSVFEQEITRWLLMAWVIAMLFHLVAWMRPSEGHWAAAEQWLSERDAARMTLAADNAVLRGRPVLDYASPPQPARPAIPVADAAGAFLAIVGTIIFTAASFSRWSGPPLTLLGIVWLAAIVLLEPQARRIAYGPHAMGLMIFIALHWLLADNLIPLTRAWQKPSLDTAAPILNLAALNALLLVAAVLTLSLRMRRRDRDSVEVAVAAILIVTALTFEAWRLVDFLINRGVRIEDAAMAKHMAMSVLWSIIGFTCVLIGFWKNIRPLRHGALALLGLTLVKIFLIDMKNVEAVWRILSFIALGSLLLGVSYLYHQQQIRARREQE